MTNTLLHLRETHNALQLPVFFFFLFFYQTCPQYCTNHIQEFGAFLNVKSHVCCDILIPSQKGFCILGNNSSARNVLRKKLLVILCSVKRKLNKLSILLLLITNYSSAYTVYLFYLSIYLTILLMVGVTYQIVFCLAESYS